MSASRNSTTKRAEITYFLAEKRQTLWAYFKSMQLHITILTAFRIILCISHLMCSILKQSYTDSMYHVVKHLLLTYDFGLFAIDCT